MENRKAELIETLLPKDTNSYGNIFGGVIMSIMDKTAGVVCWRYSKMRVVTACAQRITFHTAINVGEVVYSRATIIHVGRSSMEVEIEVDVENVIDGITRRGASGLFTMVAVGEDRKPAPIPSWKPETEAELVKWREVEKRRMGA
jgi:acyl-CoA hydrolase